MPALNSGPNSVVGTGQSTVIAVLTTPPSRLFGIDTASNEIVEFNFTSGTELSRVALPAASTGLADGLAFDGTNLFFAAGSDFGGDDVLYEIDPFTGLVTDSDTFLALGLPTAVDDLTVYHGQVIARDSAAGTAYFVDTVSDVVVGSWSTLSSVPGSVAGASERGTVFSSDAGSNQISERNSGTGLVVTTISADQ